MAPKRPAPPPPKMAAKRTALPPPAESSEENDSGSDTDGSRVEIATTKTSAPPPPPPPPQKAAAGSEDESEDSDDEEEDSDDEEEEDDANRTVPSSGAPPKPVDNEDEDEDEDEDDDEDSSDEEEEEEEGNANHMAPSSALPNTVESPEEEEEDGSSDEEEEEEEEEGTDDQEPAPKLDAEGNGRKDKKPTFHRAWSKEDEVRILEAIVAHHREHGERPKTEDLEAALAGSLDNASRAPNALANKLKSLKAMYTKNARKPNLPSEDTIDRRIFDLSKEVFGEAPAAPANPIIVEMELDEICSKYPYFAEEVRAAQKTFPGLFDQKSFMIVENKVRKLDRKIKKQRARQMKVELGGINLTLEVTKTLMKLLE